MTTLSNGRRAGRSGWLPRKPAGYSLPMRTTWSAARKFWAAQGVELPPTVTQLTGRDGGGRVHLYDGRSLLADEWPKQGKLMLDGAGAGDLKSNGWIAVAPSVHPSGRAYQCEAQRRALTAVD